MDIETIQSNKKFQKQEIVVKKLIEQKNFDKVSKFLFDKDCFIKMATAKSLIDLILTGDYYLKYDMARLFRNVKDKDVLDLLLDKAKTYGYTGKPEYGPLITAILHANGFEDLLVILKKQGESSLAGHWSNKELTRQLLGYATQMEYGIDVFIKIVPYATCQNCHEYLDAKDYIKTLQGIKITNEQLTNIQKMFEKRREDSKEDSNAIFSGYGKSIANIILEKITVE